MKLYFLLLVFLVSCSSPDVIIKEKVLVQCIDGSLVELVTDCNDTENLSSSDFVEKNSMDNESELEYVDSEQLKNETIEKTIMQELVEKAPRTYWFVEGDVGAVVKNEKRSTGFWYDPYGTYLYRLMYWDVKTNKVYVHCCELEQNWWFNRTGQELKPRGMQSTYLPAFFELNFTGNKDSDKTLIPKEFNKYWYDAKEDQLIRLFEPVYTKSPVDYMDEYVNENIIKVDDVGRMISWASGSISSPFSIHFRKINQPNHTMVFRFDKQFGVPLVIEELDESDKLLKKTIFDFDTVYGKKGKKNIRLADVIITPPENMIVITVRDGEAWKEHVEG